MKYADVKDSMKCRIRYECICLICHQPINRIEDFQYTTYSELRRRKVYCFFHTSCLDQAAREARIALKKGGGKNA